MNSSDRVIVLASDGVWDFLDSSEVIELCNSSLGNPESVAKKIVQTAADRWAKVILLKQRLNGQEMISLPS